MTEAASGNPVSPEDREKAKRFFARAKTVADTGNYDYAIELFLEGMKVDADSVDAHQLLRDISLKRKAMGGKGLGLMESMKLRNGKDERQNLLNAIKKLSYEPGSTDHMVSLMQSAHKLGYDNTAAWMGPILLRANIESKSPDANKYVALKDLYKDLKKFKQAIECCQLAMKLKPDWTDLQAEVKNLSAQETMQDAGYGSGTNFRDKLANKDQQDRLLNEEKDVVNEDVITRGIREAEADYKTDPKDLTKLSKFVEALLRIEDLEHENRAMELLEFAYEQSRLFTYRQRLGKVKMRQLARMERSMRAEAEKNPKDETLQQDYQQFRLEQINEELTEFQLALDNYPTNLELMYEVAERLFLLKRYDEAIPEYQKARNDPKLKNDATIGLGLSFLEAGFNDEAIDTLQVLIDEYQLKGDERSKKMYYWQARAFEAKNNSEMAIKRYSQVAQWEFTYKDVQARIKRLRSVPKA